jgi:hypothetical protein
MSYNAIPIAPFQVNDNFYEIGKAILKTLRVWLKEHEAKGPLTLYHYTKLEGLKGIINNRCLWCTDIFLLNDPFEVSYGRELIITTLNNFIKKEKNPDMIRLLTIILEDTESLGKLKFLHHPYVASFSTQENSFNQWGKYADNGYGYNLGFSFDSETQISNDEKIPNDEQNIRGLVLRKVIYEEREQNKFVNLYISNIVDSLRSAPGNWKTYLRKIGVSFEVSVALSVVNLLLDMMLSMKDKKHIEENEWRLIRLPRNDEIPKINNEIPNHLESYIFNIKNKLYEFPLESIAFGPKLDANKTRIILDPFLKANLSSKKKIILRKNIIKSDFGYTLKVN